MTKLSEIINADNAIVEARCTPPEDEEDRSPEVEAMLTLSENCE